MFCGYWGRYFSTKPIKAWQAKCELAYVLRMCVLQVFLCTGSLLVPDRSRLSLALLTNLIFVDFIGHAVLSFFIIYILCIPTLFVDQCVSFCIIIFSALLAFLLSTYFSSLGLLDSTLIKTANWSKMSFCWCSSIRFDNLI